MELNMLNNLNENIFVCLLEKEHRVIIIIVIIVIIMYLFVLTFLHFKIVFLKLTKQKILIHNNQTKTTQVNDWIASWI
jgi:hypothetical protein